MIEWWDEVVFRFKPSFSFTRKNLVLDAVNKDGGAHVDEVLTERYSSLIKDGSTGGIGISINDGQSLEWSIEPQLITNAHLSGLRQIGYELLNSPELITLSKR